MPYASESQRRYLHARKPSVAAKYDKHGGKGKALPKKAAKPLKGTNKRGRSK